MRNLIRADERHRFVTSARVFFIFPHYQVQIPPFPTLMDAGTLPQQCGCTIQLKNERGCFQVDISSQNHDLYAQEAEESLARVTIDTQ